MISETAPRVRHGRAPPDALGARAATAAGPCGAALDGKVPGSQRTLAFLAEKLLYQVAAFGLEDTAGDGEPMIQARQLGPSYS